MTQSIRTGTVSGIEMVSPTTFTLAFTCEPSSTYASGQYVELGFFEADGEPPAKYMPFSIASAPSEPLLHVCVKKNEGSEQLQRLASLSPGDTFAVRGPSGGFLYESEPSKAVCMIGTGTGIAPLRSMLKEHLPQRSQDVRTICLHGIFSEEEYLYREEFEGHKGLEYLPCISDPTEAWKGESGFKGQVDHYLEANEDFVNWSQTDFYLCGHVPMVLHVRKTLMERGVPRESIFHEKWIK